jgi:hypothetical protein
VVFDLLIREARPTQDAALANAMRRAGNVLLLEHLRRESPVADGDNDEGTL